MTGYLGDLLCCNNENLYLNIVNISDENKKLKLTDLSDAILNFIKAYCK